MRTSVLAASLLAVATVLGPGTAVATPTTSTGAPVDRPFQDSAEDSLLDTARYWIPQADGPAGGPAYGALRAADIRWFVGNNSGSGWVSAIIKTGSMEGVETTATLGIRTPGRVDYVVRFERSADDEMSAQILGPTGEPLDCGEPFPHYGWILDDHQRTYLRAPTACLGDPEWVRLGAATTASAPGQRFGYADDARHEGGASPDRAPRIGGPRLFPYNP